MVVVAVMGAYKYIEELWKRKQSDVLRFLKRVRCWEYRQLPGVYRLTHPTRPDKARRLGYKSKQVRAFRPPPSPPHFCFQLDSKLFDYSHAVYSSLLARATLSTASASAAAAASAL